MEDDFEPQEIEVTVIDSVSRRLRKIWTDVYEGNGKLNPSITTRLASLEDDVAGILELLKQQKKDRTAVLVAALGVFFTVLGDVLYHILTHS